MPVVVGKRQGLKALKLIQEVRDILPGPDKGRSNTYLPGSVDYVAALPGPPGKKGGKYAEPMNFDTPGRIQRIPQFEPDHGARIQNTLETLKQIINKSPQRKDGG
jgi:hypothetical protein